MNIALIKSAIRNKFVSQNIFYQLYSHANTAVTIVVQIGGTVMTLQKAFTIIEKDDEFHVYTDDNVYELSSIQSAIAIVYKETRSTMNSYKRLTT